MSLPAGVAHDLASFPAGEVAESVVPRPAKYRASVAVVMLVANESVGVLQLSPAPGLQVLGPLFSHREVPLSRNATDQSLWIFWRSKNHKYPSLIMVKPLPRCTRRNPNSTCASAAICLFQGFIYVSGCETKPGHSYLLKGPRWSQCAALRW